MKKLFLPVIAIALLLNFKNAFAQVLPNAGFEAWTTITSYEDPDLWMTGNQGSSGLGLGASVLKSTVFHGGSFAMQLQTVGTAFQFPGIACNGKIATVGIGQVAFSGGSPWTTRSSKLSGWFQYTSGAGIDSGYVTVMLFKRNGANRDTIAIGTKGLGAQTAYTLFDVNLVYQDWSMTPDSALIIIQGSKNLIAAQAGSILLVDDLSFSGNVAAGTNNISNSPVAISVYPNPATENVHFAISNISTAKILNIYDILGKKIKSVEITSAQLSVSTDGMNNSLYFYQVADRNNNVISTGKFSVKK